MRKPDMELAVVVAAGKFEILQRTLKCHDLVADIDHCADLFLQRSVQKQNQIRDPAPSPHLPGRGIAGAVVCAVGNDEIAAAEVNPHLIQPDNAVFQRSLLPDGFDLQSAITERGNIKGSLCRRFGKIRNIQMKLHIARRLLAELLCIHTLERVKHFPPQCKRYTADERIVCGFRNGNGFRHAALRFRLILRFFTAALQGFAQLIDPFRTGIMQKIIHGSMHGKPDAVQHTVRPCYFNNPRCARKRRIHSGDDQAVVDSLRAGFGKQRKSCGSLLYPDRKRQKHSLKDAERQKFDLHP